MFLAEMRANASSTVVPPSGKRRAGGEAASASQAPDTLTMDLLRYALYKGQDVTSLMNATVLLTCEEVKAEVLQNMESYTAKQLEQHQGDLPAARAKAKAEGRALAAHPWGYKK